MNIGILSNQKALTTVAGQLGHLAEVNALCFPSTPSAENSAPSGGPLGNDGRGVCTAPCQLQLDGARCPCASFTLAVDHSGVKVSSVFVGLSWDEVELLVRSVALRDVGAVFTLSPLTV